MSQDKLEDPSETDFSGGERGRFFRADAALIPPVHLEPDVLAALRERAAAEGVSLDLLVNRLLRVDIAAIQDA